MLILKNFLARRKSDDDIDPSSHGGTIKIWTLLGKEK